MVDFDDIKNVIKGPGDIEIDNPIVEGAIAVIGVVVGAVAAYKLLKNDKPIIESIMGKKDTTSEK
ncbi:hypothetical protein [Gallibacterium anatis]|uniref:hypothetical protein n=1 Tax=Gallibacterium anatis TaxID=750 RepID=UPI003006108E